MAIKKTIEIDVNTKKAVKGVEDLNESIKETNKDVKETSESSKQLGGALDSATGGAVSKFKGLTAAVKTAVTGFKSLRVAIAATGLGLLLIALVSIKTAFTSSEEGQNKFAKLLAFIGTITGNLVDLLSDLGEALISVFENPKQAIKDFANLIKNNIVTRFEGLLNLIPNLSKAVNELFKGNFSNAGKIAADAVGKVALGVDSVTDSLKNATQATKDFIKEQERELALAGKIADQRAKADKVERDLIVGKAEAERKIADLRDKAAQKDKFNASERKAFLIEASKINEDITNKEIEAAKLRRDALISENTLSKSNKDALKAEEEAKAKVIQLETNRLRLQKALSAELSSLNAQEKAANDARVKAEQDRTDREIAENEKRLQSISDLKQKFIDADKELDAVTRQEKLDLEKSRAQEDLDNLIGTETEKKEAQLALDQLYNEKQVLLNAEIKAENDKKDADAYAKSLEDKKKNAEAEKKIDQEKAAAREKMTNAIKGSLDTVSNLLGESTAAGKAASIASTTIDTIQSGVSAYKGMVAAIPGPVGIAAGAVAAAGSLASGYASVKKILAVKTPGGKGSGGAVPGGGADAPTPPAFNLVGGSNVSQVDDSINLDKPPKAYVVGSEVTNQQEIDNAQAESASLG